MEDEDDGTVLVPVHYPYIDEDNHPADDRQRVLKLGDEDFYDAPWDEEHGFRMPVEVHRWLSEQRFRFEVVGRKSHHEFDLNPGVRGTVNIVDFWIRFPDANEAFAYKMRWK
jgi:hypothetical protein